jgi:ribosomal-protein-alanine N-acetyltransferase
MGETTIHAMRWWDIPGVHAIDTNAFPRTAWTVEMFWSELAGVPETRWYVIAENEDGIVGYAGLMAVGPDADVQTLAVAPSARHSGLGRRLLEELIDEAARRGSTRIFLEVAADNEAAQRLYLHNGFEVTARRRDYYAPGLDAVMMRRSLIQPVAP